MPIFLHILFLCPFALAVSLWGRYWQWNETSPEYFLPVMLFLMRRHQYSWLLFISFLTGLTSDIITGQNWALHAAYFSILHVVISKIGIGRFMNRMIVYILMVFASSLGLFIWDVMFGRTTFSFGRAFSHCILTTLVALLMYYPFLWIRLGWGASSGNRDAPLLNG